MAVGFSVSAKSAALRKAVGQLVAAQQLPASTPLGLSATSSASMCAIILPPCTLAAPLWGFCPQASLLFTGDAAGLCATMGCSMGLLALAGMIPTLQHALFPVFRLGPDNANGWMY